MSNWINISYFRKGRVGKFIIPCHSRSRNLLKESVTSCQLVSYKNQLCSYLENHDSCWRILNFPSFQYLLREYNNYIQAAPSSIFIPYYNSYYKVNIMQHFFVHHILLSKQTYLGFHCMLVRQLATLKKFFLWLGKSFFGQKIVQSLKKAFRRPF